MGSLYLENKLTKKIRNSGLDMKIQLIIIYKRYVQVKKGKFERVERVEMCKNIICKKK